MYPLVRVGFHQVQDRGSGRWCPAHHDGGPGRYRPAAVNGVVAVAQTVGGSCRLLGNWWAPNPCW